jgi:hypothetical protein
MASVIGDVFEVAEKAAKYELMEQMFNVGVLDVEGASSFSQIDDFLMTRTNYHYKVQRWLEKIGMYKVDSQLSLF